MQITVRRSGGFAGITETKTVDTAHLHPSTAQQVEQRVRDLDFFALRADASGDAVGADMFQNEVTVHDAGQQRTISFNDDGQQQTAALRELVDTVLHLA
jgi:hypothetical protein